MKNYQRKTWNDTIKGLSFALKNKIGFSLVNFGDAELIFLSVPEIDNVNDLDLYLNISGVKKENIKLKKKMIDLIPENDFILAHTLSNREIDDKVKTTEWARFFYIWDKVLAYYNFENVNIVEDLVKKYKQIVDGSLFKLLEGKKILFVGYYGHMAEEMFKDPNFLEHYKEMNFDKVTIAGSVGCPRVKGTGDLVDEILKNVEKIDFDVALVGIGIPSLYICPKIKQMGKIAIDVGHTIQAMAGHGEIHRPYINKFNYKGQW